MDLILILGNCYKIVWYWARARIPQQYLQELSSIYYNIEVLKELISGLIPILCAGLE